MILNEKWELSQIKVTDTSKPAYAPTVLVFIVIVCSDHWKLNSTGYPDCI